MTTPKTGPLTVAEAATRYLQLLSGGLLLQSQPEINRFVRWLGSSRSVDGLSSHEVASYSESLGTTTADVLKKLEPVKSFLAWAKKEGLTVTNLGASLRPAKAGARMSRKARGSLSTEPVNLTQEGYEKLAAELETQKAERPRIAEALRLAMADKDFRENAPLDAAREHQAFVEARIRELEGILKYAQVLSGERLQTQKAILGSIVVLRDLAANEDLRFTLVHPNEVNLAQGKISTVSPIGKAILDRVAGEEIEVVAPAGVARYRIQAVESST